VLLGARLLGGADDSAPVWAMRSSMSSGASVGPDDLVPRDVRFSDAGEANRYLSAQAPPPAGSRLLRDVGAGELLPRAALGGAGDRPLVRVPLSVGAQAVPATVRAGAVVDVWVTPDAAGQPVATLSELVFDDVTVVSAPRSGTSLGPSSTRQVIVGVDEAHAEQLPEALAKVSTGTVLITERG
jgi:hypothetical protein